MAFILIATILILMVVSSVAFSIKRNRPTSGKESDKDLSVYLGQLNEVENDLQRGVLTEDQAEDIRAEVGRRMLALQEEDAPKPVADTHYPFGVLFVLVLVVFGVTAALYSTIGSFGRDDVPLASRIETLDVAKLNRPTQLQAEEISLDLLPRPEAPTEAHLALIVELREVVAQRRNDIEGLRLLARQEANLGNYLEARQLLEKVVSLQGDRVGPGDLAMLFDAMIFNANDYISPEAEAVLGQLRRLDPESLLPQFYEGMLHIQSGRPDLAFPVWDSLLEDSPPNAPWVQFVSGEMEAVAFAAGVRYEPREQGSTLRGPAEADVIAAENLSVEDRQAMIEGMVGQLMTRLSESGGSIEEWQQLIRALAVLERRSEARMILDEAMEAFGGDAASMSVLQNLAEEIGI